jgi:hypothetical protein
VVAEEHLPLELFVEAPGEAKRIPRAWPLRGTRHDVRPHKEEPPVADASAEELCDMAAIGEAEEPAAASDLGEGDLAHADVQIKVAVTETTGAGLAQLAFGEHAQQLLRAQKRRHTGLIVVASYINLPYNLGGLTRTCEIFGAEALVLPHDKYTKTKVAGPCGGRRGRGGGALATRDAEHRFASLWVW